MQQLLFATSILSVLYYTIYIVLRTLKHLNTKWFFVFSYNTCLRSGFLSSDPRTQISSLVRRKKEIRKAKIGRSEFVLFCLAYALAATINAWRRSNFRFQSTAVDYRGITADKSSITAVTPQQLTPSSRYYRNVHRENPRYYRGYRGITAVPITVQRSNSNFTWPHHFLSLLFAYSYRLEINI